LALHRVFDCPRDKIIWDVGHQSYTHKILTGRRDRFSTLRQFGGLSGFPARSESESDAFGTGHASTSISAALGIAAARDLKKEDFNVIAVIGDGAFTGGMAFEALNNAGELKKKLLVVLNDNEMSIAKNVGALSEYFYRMRTGATYKRIRRDIDAILKSIPSIGDRMLRTAERVKNSVKFLLVPGMLFEELGLNYIGPVDGHDIGKMVEIFELTKKYDRPVVAHVLTCKGKGYVPAEKKAAAFHGTGPFKVETGDKETKSRAVTYTEAFSKVILELAEKDRRITAITAAMTDGTGLSAFAGKYPDRFFDVGIAEQHAVTLAAGMACEGLRPVVAVYSTFAQRAYDQLIHDVCLQNLPVVFAFDRAGLVGDDGATHHGTFSFSFLRSAPNMVICAPKNENELQAMIRTAFTINGPAAVFYPRGPGAGAPLDEEAALLPVGRAEQIIYGQGVVIWAIGSMVEHAGKICGKLADFGIKAGLVNARFVKPLDRELLAQTAGGCGYMITLEENVLAGGFGSAVLEELQAAGILDKVKTLSLGLPDCFVPHGNKDALFKSLGLDVDSLAGRIAAFCRV
ncbi:MAG: 1-deoxy-D-xylulose-5-phosphate synthase, partial [Acidaminococcales bacterium]|nr:1-deoxy-D-xylulose-5-phosphate synthase [Acidaminococcales bacterium]